MIIFDSTKLFSLLFLLVCASPSAAQTDLRLFEILDDHRTQVNGANNSSLRRALFRVEELRRGFVRSGNPVQSAKLDETILDLKLEIMVTGSNPTPYFNTSSGSIQSKRDTLILQFQPKAYELKASYLPPGATSGMTKTTSPREYRLVFRLDQDASGGEILLRSGAARARARARKIGSWQKDGPDGAMVETSFQVDPKEPFYSIQLNLKSDSPVKYSRTRLVPVYE